MKQKRWCICNNSFNYIEKVTTMTFFRNRMFLEGIAFGGICGIIIGSIIAFTLGESSIEAIRRLIQKRLSRKRGVEYKYLFS